MRWEGVHTALVTPFRDDDGLDVAAFRLQVRRQVDGGVQGVVVAGTTGEAPTLEDAERSLLLAIAREESKQRCVVTMGVGTNSTRRTVANISRAQLEGADAGLLVLPYYNKPNRAGLLAHVECCAAEGLPLIVYHVPGRTGQRVSPTDLAALCNVRGVVACKEATGDVTYGQDLMCHTQAPVLSGDDFTWLPLLSVGGTGVISVLSNVAPAMTGAVWAAWQAGKTAEARRIHAELYPVCQALFAEVNPVPVKAALAMMGLGSARCRLPLAAGTWPAGVALDGLS